MKIKKVLALAAINLFGYAAAQTTGTVADLVVNEVMASNVDMFLDPSFNYGSWLELYNPKSGSISVGDIYISDDETNLKKYYIPKDFGTIAARKHLVIWFDHHGVWNEGEMRQVDFKLDYDGGTIFFSDKKGNVLLKQEYPAAISRTSYARKKDGGSEWGMTAMPTPGESNSSSEFATEQCEAPVFSVDGGVLQRNSEITFNVTIPEGATLGYKIVRYWDGSIPTLDDYATEFVMGTNEVSFTVPEGEDLILRCRTFQDGKIPSEVVTRSFFHDRGYTLPIISVVGDYENIWGDEYGIMTQGGIWEWDERYDSWYLSGYNGRPGNGKSSPCNWNMDWDRPVNFEYITDKGEYALSQEVDMSMCGGWSRAYTPHSFKIKAAKYYMGKNSLDYDFFAQKPNHKHKTLQIRQGGNDNYGRLKDAALQQIVITSGLKIDAQTYQPCHVFINGDYQGTLNMREPNNKHFAYSNYGIDADDIDQFEMSPDSGYVQKEGTDEAFLRWYDLSANAAEPDVYEEIKQLVDIDEYINYMAVELYLGNTDWPQNNVKGFRDRNDGKFHFVLFDLDQAFYVGESTVFTTLVNKKNYSFNSLLGYDQVGNCYPGKKIKEEIKMVTIFLNMLNNEEFRKQFVDVFCILDGSVFVTDRVKSIVNEVSQKLVVARNTLDADVREGSYDNSYFFSPSSTASEILGKFSTTRSTNIINALKNYAPMGIKSVAAKSIRLSSNIPEAKVFINDIEVPTGSFSGKLFRPVTFRTEAPAGYRFCGWTKEVRTLEPDEYEYLSTDMEYELEVSGSPSRLKAIYAPMRDDLMIAAKACPVTVNEICAGNSIYANDYFKKSDCFELYNTTDRDIDIAGLYITDNIDKPQKYQVPTDDVRLNTVIPAHGYKIVWADKRENISQQIHASFKLDADGGVIAIFADPAVADKSLFDGIWKETWCDSLSYGAMSDQQSVGRYPDGCRIAYIMTDPTIGTANKLSSYSELVWKDEEAINVGIDAVEAEVLDGGVVIAYAGEGIVNVKTDGAAIRDVRVYNMSGQRQMSDISLRNGDTFATLTLQSLASGVYVVEVLTENGRSTGKFYVRSATAAR